VNYNRTPEELEELLFFCVAVAGKMSRTVGPAVKRFFEHRDFHESPFDYLRRLLDSQKLLSQMRLHKLGQYTKLLKFSLHITKERLDLPTARLEGLESIYGIGPKTARFFLLYTRPDQNIAVLDTHILAYLREHGYAAPKATPQNRTRYRDLEVLVLKLAKEAGMSPVEFDDYIWNTRSKKIQSRV
jgi:thermostable 8-oxoguanine DNA glycosylase